MTDITFDLNNIKINLRVGAVVRRGDEVLVCRMRTEAWWFLPGGRIKTGESSFEAINRELREEIGDCFQIQRPIVCAENFFTLGGVVYHELCLFYEASFDDGASIRQYMDTNEVLEWIRRRDVTRFDLRPEFIKQHIIEPPSAFALVIHRNGQQSHAANADIQRR